MNKLFLTLIFLLGNSLIAASDVGSVDKFIAAIDVARSQRIFGGDMPESHEQDVVKLVDKARSIALNGDFSRARRMVANLTREVHLTRPIRYGQDGSIIFCCDDAGRHIDGGYGILREILAGRPECIKRDKRRSSKLKA